ncbi:hypothetical protein ACNFJ7_04375 [Sphingomonas sp. HT-1]|uniref:hypothetical protein n=1 Tax=unclassified Sphingomonas TaxID=196159 RepID=UPI00128F629F|nr:MULTISPECIES: hypothetical protein [unclassified Sphingomonas]
MTVALEAEVQPATLSLPLDQKFMVERGSDLHAALKGLPDLSSGQSAKLERGPKHYIEAVRHGDLWAVRTRKGSYFSLASFTAELSTDYSDRKVKESRAAGSIWKRIKRSIMSPYPERSLSTEQVQTLFAEFFAGRKFSLAKSGA